MMAHTTSSWFQGEKRGFTEAFVNGTDAQVTDSPYKRRVKTDDGHGAYTVDVQKLFVKKKKNTYEDCFSEVPPAGFQYLPVGFRRIKEWCRDECLRKGIQYYVVSLFPNKTSQSKTATNMITRNIYRHGWHFPQDMVLAAFAANGLTNQQSVSQSRNPILRRIQADSASVTEDNLTDLFKDLFPGMPDKDISSVINHAFKQGSGRVGDSEQLEYVRRVQLAVLAHIRHVYTDYDSRLKSKMNSRSLARLNIEKQCLSKLLKWRGEDDEYELEERDAEVVIIEDSDDESDDVLEEWEQFLSRRAESPGSEVEIIGYRDIKKSKEKFKGDLPAVFYSPKFAGLAARRSMSRLPRTPQLTAVDPVIGQHSVSFQNRFGHASGLASRIAALRETSIPMRSSGSRDRLQTPQNHGMISSETLSSHRIMPYAPFDAPPQSRMPEQPSFSDVNHEQEQQTAAAASWPRPVTVLADSSAGIPQTVVDKHGNIFHFDAQSRTVTPTASPNSGRTVARSIESPYSEAATGTHPPQRLSSANTNIAALSSHSSFIGSDGRVYRLVPAPQIPVSPKSIFPASSGKHGYELIPAHAQYIDLTADDAPAHVPTSYW